MKTALPKCFLHLPYHQAAYIGDLEHLKKGSIEEINQSDDRGLTPLHVAILSQEVACASYLIENGADLNVQTKVPLSSIDTQDRDRAKSIFYRINVTEWDFKIPLDKKVTALHLAAMLGQDELVLLLCKNKAKVNLRSHGGVSPLHYAALFGYSTVVDTLLSFKAKVHFKTKSQSVCGWFDADMTAIHAAAQSGNCQAIKRLIDSGSPINDFTKGGCGTIFFSARSGNAAAVKLLLDAGAPAQTATPRYFNNPLSECTLRSDATSFALIMQHLNQLDGIEAEEAGRKVYLWQPPIRMAIRYQNQEIINLLLEVGAQKPQYQDIDEAMMWGDVATVLELHSSGKRPGKVGFHGNSPLYEVVRWGHVELVQFLLEHGYATNISEQELNSRDKNTPLHIATIALTSTTHPLEDQWHWKRSYKIAELLLENGADPNAVNYFGNTPLHFPNIRKDHAMIELLLKYGADPTLLKGSLKV